MTSWAVIVVAIVVGLGIAAVVLLAFLYVTDRAIAHRQELDEIAANLRGVTTNVHVLHDER